MDTTIQTSGTSARTGVVYQLGFKSLDENVAVDAIDAAWEQSHPKERQVHMMGVRYPSLVSARVDHVITTTGVVFGVPDEWGIEVKRLQFVGDNRKRNDYATAKVLSPYLKDRGVLHDALRLREYGFTQRVAVIGYSFDYDSATRLRPSCDTHRTKWSSSSRKSPRSSRSMEAIYGLGP